MHEVVASDEEAPIEQRRKEIIEVAINQLVEKGYEGTSKRNHCYGARMNKGGLYYHLKSKDEILVAAKWAIFGTDNGINPKSGRCGLSEGSTTL